jgi:hypothetical protein
MLHRREGCISQSVQSPGHFMCDRLDRARALGLNEPCTPYLVMGRLTAAILAQEVRTALATASW